MIYVYGLSYYTTKYVLASVNSIALSAKEEIHFTVVDNKSENSPEIRKKLWDYGLVSRLVGMKGNSRGNALIDTIRAYPPGLNSEDFFVITDLDLLVPDNLDWTLELRKCREAGANIAGFNLSLENYLPPNRGHDTAGIGWWLMMLDEHKFFELPQGIAYTDHYLINQLGPLHRASGELYHMNWDCHKDYPEYWALKDQGIPWHQYEPNEIEEVWEH